MNLNNQPFIKGLIIAVIIAAAIGALTVLAGDSIGRGAGEITGKLFLSSLSLIFFGITATICMVVSANPKYKNLGYTGAMVSAAAFLLVMILIFTGISAGDLTIPQFTFSLFIASIALAHICLLHHFNLHNKYANTARIIATVFISIFSIVIIVNIFGAGDGIQSLMTAQSSLKMGVASLIIDLAATLLVPLCNRLKVEETVKFSFTEEQVTSAQEEQKTQARDSGEQDPVL